VSAAWVRTPVDTFVQAQFAAHRALAHDNPNVKNLREDFGRFGITLDLAGTHPANPARVTHLGELNR
jgi:hypothetical protein